MAASEVDLLQLAATGDRAAQSAMVWECVSKQFSGLTPFEALALAEPFARQAAEHGQAEDVITLAGVLRVRAYHVDELGDRERALALLGYSETLLAGLSAVPFCEGATFLAAVLTTEADEGSVRAVELLDRLSASMTPSDADTMRLAVNAAAREQSGVSAQVAA